MKFRIFYPAVLLSALAIPCSGMAEVTAMTAGGFTVKHSLSVAANNDAVYAAIQKIGQWWNPDHSWTGEAANLYFDARLDGCFCERLPDGGGVEHLRIIYLAPGKQIRFDGALGPLQGMAINGRMLWNIEGTDSGSTITFTYNVMGFMEGGFDGLAPAVDGVIGEQLTRLGEFLAAPSQ
jgi:hypothetical protein